MSLLTEFMKFKSVNFDEVSAYYIGEEGKALPIKNCNTFFELVRWAKCHNKNKIGIILYKNTQNLESSNLNTTNNQQSSSPAVNEGEMNEKITKVNASTSRNPEESCKNAIDSGELINYLDSWKSSILKDLELSAEKKIHEIFEIERKKLKQMEEEILSNIGEKLSHLVLKNDIKSSDSSTSTTDIVSSKEMGMHNDVSTTTDKEQISVLKKKSGINYEQLVNTPTKEEYMVHLSSHLENENLSDMASDIEYKNSTSSSSSCDIIDLADLEEELKISSSEVEGNKERSYSSSADYEDLEILEVPAELKSLETNLMKVGKDKNTITNHEELLELLDHNVLDFNFTSTMIEQLQETGGDNISSPPKQETPETTMRINLRRLYFMGFKDVALNETLLFLNNNNISDVISILLNFTKSE